MKPLRTIPRTRTYNKMYQQASIKKFHKDSQKQSILVGQNDCSKILNISKQNQSRQFNFFSNKEQEKSSVKKYISKLMKNKLSTRRSFSKQKKQLSIQKIANKQKELQPNSITLQNNKNNHQLKRKLVQNNLSKLTSENNSKILKQSIYTKKSQNQTTIYCNSIYRKQNEQKNDPWSINIEPLEYTRRLQKFNINRFSQQNTIIQKLNLNQQARLNHNLLSHLFKNKANNEQQQQSVVEEISPEKKLKQEQIINNNSESYIINLNLSRQDKQKLFESSGTIYQSKYQ